MTKLPKGWVQMALGEAIQIQKGKKPIGLGPKSDSRSIPYINISAFETKQVEEYAPEQEVHRCSPSDTLLVWDGARAGLAGRGIGGFIGSTLVRLTSDLVSPAYLFYFVHSNYGYLNTHTKGVGIPHIDPVILAGIPLLLPPYAEQTRIVVKLEELLTNLESGMAEIKVAQKKVKQYRQSLLKSAVEGSLTAEWRAQFTPIETGAELLQRILTERRARWEAKQLAKFKAQGKSPPKDWQKKYPEPLQADISGLLELPKGWVWASVDQLAEFITSGSRGWAAYYTETGATFIRSQNINKDWLDLSDIAFVSPPAGSEGARTRVQQDDVLLTITGANVGKAAHVETELEEAYVSQHVALIRVVEPALAELLHLFLTADAGGRGQLNKEAYGAGKPGLNLQQVAAVSIPLASPFEIQALLSTVAVQLQAAGENEAALTVALKQSTAQRQNILRAAFTGQLVPQDPSDEPASVLLTRIRAQREERAKQPKVRKTKQQKEISAVVSKLLDVLAEAGDWVPAQEAFSRCGALDGTPTVRIEELYAELRELHVVEKRIQVKPVIDELGRKTGDLLKLIVN
ncbi:restriction endonuclease subunit S [Pseudomonas guineae]|uniref:restriction endonuclease subunit S n=1 Tax=Pseudomonas guineae TaxID=425504 RepID=UPI003D0560EA